MQYSRDQFLRALQLVIDHNLADVEKLFRARTKLTAYDMEDIAAVQTAIAAFKKVVTIERPGADGGIHVSSRNLLV